MSLSVIAYPFPRGRGVLLLEPIPALSQGEGRVLPGQVACTSTCSSALPGAVIWTSDLPITSVPALPAQLQPHHNIIYYIVYKVTVKI